MQQLVMGSNCPMHPPQTHAAAAPPTAAAAAAGLCDVDGVSSLECVPFEILSLIMDALPSDDAARLSAVSKRWCEEEQLGIDQLSVVVFDGGRSHR